MNRRELKSLIRRSEAIQVDQIWMQVSSFNFLSQTDRNEDVLILKAMAPGMLARKFTWEQLLKARVENQNELVLRDGTRMIFYKLKPIELSDATGKGRLQHK